MGSVARLSESDVAFWRRKGVLQLVAEYLGLRTDSELPGEL
jgi:hypothetical protein